MRPLLRKIFFLPFFATSCQLASVTNLIAQPNHPWQMFHKDAGHAGFAGVTGPQTAALKWQYYGGVIGMNLASNSVAISSSGTIYVGGPDKFYALDRTGNLKWSKFYMNPQGPAISKDGNSIYFASDSFIVCVDTLGNFQWKYKTGAKTIFGITVSPDTTTIYQGSWDHYIYALNANGTLKWKYLTAGCVSYPVSIAKDGTLIIGGGDANCGSDPNVYALYPNGTLRWQYTTASLRCGSPAIGFDSLIYVPAGPTLYVLDINGNLKWSIGGIGDPVSGIISPAIASDGTIYIGNSQGVITAIDPITHAKKWTYQTGPDPNQAGFYGVIGFPVVDKFGNLYVGAVDYKMYAIDKFGNLKWSYLTGNRPSESSPALDTDGTLYFSSDDGYLYAFWDTTVTIGIAEMASTQKEVYVTPNPFSVSATVVIPSSLVFPDTRLELFNVVGKKIKNFHSYSGNIQIHRGNLSQGIYFYRLLNDEKTIGKGKIIIE